MPGKALRAGVALAWSLGGAAPRLTWRAPPADAGADAGAPNTLRVRVCLTRDGAPCASLRVVFLSAAAPSLRRSLAQAPPSVKVPADYNVTARELTASTLFLAAPCVPINLPMTGTCAPSTLRAVILASSGVTLAAPPGLPALAPRGFAVAGVRLHPSSAFPAPLTVRVTEATRAVLITPPVLALGADNATASITYALAAPDGLLSATAVRVEIEVAPVLLPVLSRYRRWPLWAMWPSSAAGAAVDWWAGGGGATPAAAPALPAAHYLVWRVLAPPSTAPANATRLAPFLHAWGRNNAGQLGTGDALPRAEPALAAPAAATTDAAAPRFVAVSAAAGHALGLTADGRVFAWGAGATAALGQGPGAATEDAYAPRLVAGGGLSSVNVTAVVAGGGHSLALTSDGTLYSWGDNARGQLGRPAASDAAAGSTPPASLPAPVRFGALPASPRIVAVAAGRAHSLAVSADGGVWCFGDDSAAQCGGAACGRQPAAPAPANATPCAPWAPGEALLARSVPSPARLAALAASPARSVAAAGDASFAITADGRLHGWGDNALGVLGLGPALTDAVVPIPSALPGLERLEVVDVFASATSRHALALVAGGALYCWGDNGRAQCGLGAPGSGAGLDFVPAVVASPRRVRALAGVPIATAAAGLAHSLAVSDAGEVFAWGSDSFAQCGVSAAPSPNATLTRRGWLSPDEDADVAEALRNGTLFDATPLDVQTQSADSGEESLYSGDDYESVYVPATWASRRRRLQQAGAVVYPTLRPALSGAAFAAAASGASLATAASAGWGGALGHGVGSAGAPARIVPFPALVSALQQADAVAAGGGSSFAVRRGCAPGAFLDRASGSCAPCARGFASAALSVLACVRCPAGQASGDLGSTACVLCAPGGYAGAGASACTPCAAGTFLPFPGATAAATPALPCLPCARGTASGVAGAAACRKCAPGTFAERAAALRCTDCAAGTYNPRTGANNATQCIDCPRRVYACGVSALLQR